MCVCVGARGLKSRLLTAKRNPHRYHYPKKKWSHHGKNDERTHQNSDEVAQVPFSKIFTLRLVSVPRVLVNQGGYPVWLDGATNGTSENVPSHFNPPHLFRHMFTYI